MFESLSERLSGILDKLTRRGALTEEDVNAAMREVRRALLEADVALDVVRSFTDKVRARAVGQEVIRSVTPGQQVIKIVHDTLVDMLGSDARPIDLEAPAPVAIMMVGLQGSGKTTTTAKIGLRLTARSRRKVLLASLDTRRPAAQEQLRVLGAQNDVDTLPIVAGQSPTQIAERAMTAGRLGGYDVVILDTAGRIHIDEQLMLEMAEIKRVAKPHEILLVADALTGQDAVNLAKSFDERVGLTGIVLTRMDGDGRGGAALSMRAVTGKPIKLIGVGEKADALEDFDPARIAGRILGMGDIVALVERAAQEIDVQKAAKAAQRMQKGLFDLDDLAEQLRQMEKMGGMKGMMALLPGMGKMSKELDKVDDRIVKRQIAIISSMTSKERRKPELLNASRKRRVAAGSGTRVEDINRLLKQHRQMADMMKMLGKKKGGMLGGLGSMLGMGGGAPQMDPAELERLAKSGKLPDMPPGFGGGGGLPPMPPGGLGLPPGMGFPGPKGPGGFPTLPGLGKKK
ncbi:signal recognition particle protein [Prosthecodimorpha staleyi]|uniref:Signal recognition particle protein n=1 Tax=Prosthecodimorpha staleyi TaxID=2840188 RepID=A0A947D253_9HYPH|nr:signal recognition particle protein [Prosthecodimorpha staleyi]MBT9289573.1 signal recognition particle protein [Prosthecodimorpha staleyi]